MEPRRAPQALIVERAGRHRLDLGRDVHALFGLVFDATTLDGARDHLLQAMAQHERCFLSTPNINFAMAAQRDPTFRDSVRRSDFSVPDGAPIVRIARWMGLPLTERVAGSDLFAALRHGGRTPPIRVYFFGGPPGVSAAASEVLRQEGQGMTGVGGEEAGWGDVASMSSPELLARMAQAEPDLISVALGAKKGQAWIEHNRERLPPAVVSHLGAVVNFVAGRVQRAPALWQRLGLEWLWRIVEEPGLWQRYAGDGWALLRVVATKVWPWRRALAQHADVARVPAQWQRQLATGHSLYALSGALTASAIDPLRALWHADLQAGLTLRLNLREVSHVDSAFLGLAAMVQAWQGGALIDDPHACSAWVRQTFEAHGVDDLLAHTAGSATATAASPLP